LVVEAVDWSQIPVTAAGGSNEKKSMIRLMEEIPFPTTWDVEKPFKEWNDY